MNAHRVTTATVVWQTSTQCDSSRLKQRYPRDLESGDARSKPVRPGANMGRFGIVTQELSERPAVGHLHLGGAAAAVSCGRLGNGGGGWKVLRPPIPSADR